MLYFQASNRNLLCGSPYQTTLSLQFISHIYMNKALIIKKKGSNDCPPSFCVVCVCVFAGLMPLPGGLPPLPNLPNLNLPLPDLSAVSLPGQPPVGTTGKCIHLCLLLLQHRMMHSMLYMHALQLAPKVLNVWVSQVKCWRCNFLSLTLFVCTHVRTVWKQLSYKK